MADPHYPSVDIDFIQEKVIASEKLAEDGILKVGNTTAFILEGNNAVHKRTILIRELQPGQVCFEQATALAIKFSFLGNLLTWLEDKRNWKEGAYIVKEAQPVENGNGANG